jgi:hypothetical protein
VEENLEVEIQEAILILPRYELLALIFRKKRLTEKEKRLALSASKQPIKANKIFFKKNPEQSGFFILFVSLSP